jgi:hypothetical protein
MAQVDVYIKSNGLHERSVDVSSLPLLQLSPEADAARHASLKALDELRAHLLGLVGVDMSHSGDVRGSLKSLYKSVANTRIQMAQLPSPHGLAEFNVPDGAATTILDLAHRTGMHTDEAKTLVLHASPSKRHFPGTQFLPSSACSWRRYVLPALHPTRLAYHILPAPSESLDSSIEDRRQSSHHR